VFTGQVTVSGTGVIPPQRCEDGVLAAPGVASGDFVLLEQPAAANWTAGLTETAAGSMTVRVCNHAQNARNPTGFTLRFMALRAP
jgi:hypothetical protein